MRKIIIDIDIPDNILLILFNYSFLYSQEYSILLLFHSIIIVDFAEW